MSKIVDIVNLNADASCLASGDWLRFLEGGPQSEVYKFFNSYIETNRKITLGVTGATLADIYVHNHESIELIKNNLNLFEFIVRPFAHDIALLRGKEGFKFNLSVGKKSIEKVFGKVHVSYLPPEFMLTNSQIKFLKGEGLSTTFINPARYSSNAFRIPKKPYILEGTINSKIGCIPIESSLTKAYLHGIHHYNADKWNNILENNHEVLFSWRDGESPFLIPDGVEREKAWLSNESKSIERIFLSELTIDFKEVEELSLFRHQPVHSFSAWMKEFRMMYFVNEILLLEKDLNKLSDYKQLLWLYLINSDILSAVEKNSPVISLADRSGNKSDYTILRAEKNIEGDELLELIKEEDSFIKDFVDSSSKPYARKLRGRIKFLNDKKIL